MIPVIIALAFVPFTITYHHEISVLSILFQIILSPLLLLYDIFALFSFIGLPIYELLNGYTSFLNSLLNFVKPLFIKIYVPDIGIPFKVIYEAIYLITFYFISIGLRDIYKYLLIVSISFLSVFLIPTKSFFSSVSFINVGQGDSCLIHDKGVTIMIDTGGLTYSDIAKDCLIPYLKNEQIYKIDLLITTHDDFDHSGGKDSLINNFRVDNYIKSYEYFPLQIGDMTLYNYNTYKDLWKEENDESLVIGFNIKGYEFLITGDAPKKIENKIVEDYPNIRCDYLKVGHHGSNTSSSETFINKLKPKEAIISCGMNNKYGHPHKEVISILNKNKVKIRRTDLEGTIKYSFI